MPLIHRTFAFSNNHASMRKSTILLIIAVPLAFGLGLLLRIPSCSEQQRKNGLVEDSTVIKESQWRDREGKLHTEIKALQAESTRDFLKMKYQDSMLQELQKTVQEYKKKLKHGGSVVQVREKIVYRNVADMNPIIDSLKDIRITNPYRNPQIFHVDIFEKDGVEWGRLSLRGRLDSLEMSMLVENAYTATIYRKKSHLFKPDEYAVEVKNLNPFVEEEELRAVQINGNVKRKHIGIGPMVGVGLGYDLRIHPVVGVGLQWNVIQF